MKKKVINKIISFILVASVFICATCAMPSVEADAAVSAKSLLSSALKVMKSYDKITYKYDLSRNIDGELENCRGICMSDATIDYGFYCDTRESDKYWEEYEKGKYIYRKPLLSDNWKVYTITNYKSKGIESLKIKKSIEYMLCHLKNAKIVSVSTSSYTITAVPNYATRIKGVRIVIDKKKKCVTEIKFVYKTYRGTYLNSTNTYLVKNEVERLTHISYGKGRLYIPSGM